MRRDRPCLVLPPIRPGVPVPLPTSPPYPVLKAPARGAYDVYCLSPSVLSYRLHYQPRDTWPCPFAPSPCQCNPVPHVSKWAGYLAGWVPVARCRKHWLSNCPECKSWRFWVVEVTPGAYRANAELRQREGDLRGVLLRLSRFRAHPQAPVRVQLMKGPVPVADLPKPFDLHAALLRLWGVEEQTQETSARPVTPGEGSTDP